MKFSKEASYEHPMTLTFPDAYKVVWDAGNMALGCPNDDVVKGTMSEELGNIFAKLDATVADAAVIAEALPGGEIPKIPFVSLLSDYTTEQQQIRYSQGYRGDSKFNPFLVHDDRLIAIESLSLYLAAANNSLHDTAS